jgi:hypothetical protein
MIKRIRRFFQRQTVANLVEAEQFRQGVIASNMGMTPTWGWNRHQLAGYRMAQAVVQERNRLWGGRVAA